MLKILSNLFKKTKPAEKALPVVARPMRKEQRVINLNNKSFDELIELTKDWCGYTREAAVRALGEKESPQAIQVLIPRLNDWVIQVREASKHSLFKLMMPKNIQFFINALPNFYHLQKCERASHDSLISKDESFVIKQDVRHLLIGLNSNNLKVIRASFRLLKERELIDKNKLIKMGLSSLDVPTRIMATDKLREREGQNQLNLLQQATIDPFMPIRREAVQLLIKYHPSSINVEEYLFDSHKSIRNIAIKHLPLKEQEILEIYKDKLNSNNSAAIQRYAVWALGELGDKSELKLLEHYAQHEYSSVRAQSYNSIVKLLNNSSLEYLKEGLTDRAPKVTRECAKQVIALGERFIADDLISLSIKGAEHHHLQTCCFMAKSFNKWERLKFLLIAIEHPLYKEKNYQDLINFELSYWASTYNRSQVSTNAEQVDWFVDNKELLDKYRLTTYLSPFSAKL